MGLIKTAGKVLGTVALAATGTASTVLKGVSDTVGIEIGSSIFGAVKDASFSGIRSMWDSGSEQSADMFNKAEETGHKLEENMQSATRRKMAETARNAAMVAKRNGNEELYEKYMEQYETYKD